MLGEATYRASPASDASFLEEFPEAARIESLSRTARRFAAVDACRTPPRLCSGNGRR